MHFFSCRWAGLDLLEAYGCLLDKLGDRYEAGKYLFLSGKERPEYQEAISIYLSRNKRRTASELISQFPKSIRKYGGANLPDKVRQLLLASGASDSDLERRELPSNRAQKLSWKNCVAIGALVSILFSLAALCIVGFMTLISWII